MKNLLLILILVLGSNITYSQGQLGDTEEQLKIFFKDMNFSYDWADWPDRGNRLYSSFDKDSTVNVIHYLSTDGVVWGTIIYPMQDDTFTTYINTIDMQYFRVEPGIWHNYLDDGIVVITLVTDDAERPYFKILFQHYPDE